MRISLIILLLGLSHSLSAQFNISVGYTIGYTPAQEINELVFEFNETFRDGTYFGMEMPDLNYLHGLQAGLRWKYDRFSFELNWENLNRTREALGETEADQLFQKTIFYNINNYAAGLESNFGNFGAGIFLGLRNFKIKEEIAVTGKRRSFLEDNQYFVKPVISINLIGGDKVGLSIKPYLQIPLSSIPLNNLSKEFFGQDIGTDRTDRLLMGGVSFIFYNGSQ